MDITSHIEARGLSRAEVCREAGISASYLSMIEAGARQVGPNRVAALARALGVSVGDLRPDLAGLFSGEQAAQ